MESKVSVSRSARQLYERVCMPELTEVIKACAMPLSRLNQRFVRDGFVKFNAYLELSRILNASMLRGTWPSSFRISMRDQLEVRKFLTSNHGYPALQIEQGTRWPSSSTLLAKVS